MTDLNEGIVEEYAEHLLRRASAAVVTFAVGGAIGGAALGAVPGLLSHSVISPGANYFAVLLGAIAGGIFGRSLGDKRAVGLRLQAKMAMHQLQFESRAVLAQAAPVARPVAPAPAPPAAPAPVPAPAPAPPAVAPPAAAPPLAEPPVAAPTAVPVAPPVAAPAIAPQVAAPPPAAPVPLAPAPLLPAAPAAPPASPVLPVIRTEATAGATQPLPRLLEQAAPGLPPLSSPPLSG